MPRTVERVVCALRETTETLEPTSALISVDLPALGAPIKATKPQEVPSVMRVLRSRPTRHESLRGGLFGGAFGGRRTLRRLKTFQGDLHRKERRVRRPGATDLDINRRVERTGLRPFLHRRLGVARGLGDRVHAGAPRA